MLYDPGLFSEMRKPPTFEADKKPTVTMAASSARMMQELLQELTAQVEQRDKQLSDAREHNIALDKTIEKLLLERQEFKQSVRRELMTDLPRAGMGRLRTAEQIFSRLKVMVSTDD